MRRGRGCGCAGRRQGVARTAAACVRSERRALRLGTEVRTEAAVMRGRGCGSPPERGIAAGKPVRRAGRKSTTTEKRYEDISDRRYSIRRTTS